MHLTTPVAAILNANAVIAHDDDDGQLKHCMQMHIYYTSIPIGYASIVQQVEYNYVELHLLTMVIAEAKEFYYFLESLVLRSKLS